MPMNKDYILFHLKEAQEEITKTIRDIETDEEYEYGDFVVAMSHLYHHVNTAWNARDTSDVDADACSEKDFARWRQMPNSSELLLEAE